MYILIKVLLNEVNSSDFLSILEMHVYASWLFDGIFRLVVYMTVEFTVSSVVNTLHVL